MKCKICGQKAINFGGGTYYIENCQDFLIPFYYCHNCNCFTRDVDDNFIFSHLKSASYTNVKNEKKFYRQRIKFFKYLFSLTKKHTNHISNWLDLGCSYGHLIDFLNLQGVDSDGIEISEEARKFAQNKGLGIFEKIESLPKGKKYDVISLIDSLYYIKEPISLIKKLYDITSSNGLLIIRITNRNWLAKLKKSILGREPGSVLGDATISYSKESIAYLLENNGFKILNITSIEKGKSIAIKTKIFYILTSVLNILSFNIINISPGLVVIAKKNPMHNICLQ